jgi:hypothetical protein
MIIESRFLPSGALQMDVFTFDREEFSAIDHTLSLAGIQLSFQRLPNDSSNRMGRRYTVRQNELAQLETVLEGHFLRSGLFAAAAGSGGNYRCKEVKLSGGGKGCEDLTAGDLSIAQVKCALIARRRNWFGGVPSPGTCP